VAIDPNRVSVDAAILEALATYRYLTAEQMLRLGVTRDYSYLNERLRAIARRKPMIIHRLRDEYRPPRPYLHWLTPKGAKRHFAKSLAEGDLIAPTADRPPEEDFDHRLACVDFHIALRQWASAAFVDIDWYHADYDPVEGGAKGGRPSFKTTISTGKRNIVPDGVFAYTDGMGTQRLYVLEMNMGDRPLRVVKKLLAYGPALRSQAIQQKYEFEFGARILFVFVTNEALEKVRMQLVEKHQDVIADVEHLFFFKTLTDVQEEFYQGWQKLSGEETRLL